MKYSILTMILLAVIISGLNGSVFADTNYGTIVSLGGKTFKSISAPDWSPDGKWITFSASTEKPEVVYDNEVLDSQRDIWIVSPQGGVPKNLTNAIYGGDYQEGFSWPNFSYDSSEVTYSKSLNLFEKDGLRQEFTIESVNIETGDRTVIVEKNSHLGFWSDDGQYLVYIDMTGIPTIDYQDEFSFKVLDYNRNNKVFDLTFSEDKWPQFDFGNSCFSHDNTSFLTTLFEKEWEKDNNAWAVYKIPLDGSEPQKLISEGSPWYPRYSPDGKWILYSNWYADGSYPGTNNGPYPKQFAQLCVYSVEYEDIIVLLPDCPYWNFYGSWSPDGTQICYLFMDDSHTELRILDFEYAEPEIQVNVEDETPDGFALTGNYPNPFNPTTTIEFSLPETGFTDLVIFNMTGQKVRELMSGTMSAGKHSVVWDGRDDSGITVSAGMYLTRLRMGENVQTGSMMLVK